MKEYPAHDSYSSNSERDPLIAVRPSNFDNALDSTGVGFFHFILVLVAGWALASDSVEVQCISFVTPQLGNDPDPPLRPSNVRERFCCWVFIASFVVVDDGLGNYGSVNL